MKTIKYTQLTSELLKFFPHFQKTYNEKFDYFKPDEPGHHVVYGDLLLPYLLECVRLNKVTELHKIFDFLEFLSNQENLKIQEVVQMSVLESLGKDEILLEKIQEYMGPATKKLSDEIEKFWNKEP